MAKKSKKKQQLWKKKILENSKSQRKGKIMVEAKIILHSFGWVAFSLSVPGARLSWIHQNVQWPTTRYSSIFKATKRHLFFSTCTDLDYYYGVVDGNQWVGTIRNEMLLKVLLQIIFEYCQMLLIQHFLAPWIIGAYSNAAWNSHPIIYPLVN